MKLTFYGNYLNHHQVYVADEFYRILGDDYKFVATLPRDIKALKGGVDYSNRPYCIMAGESEKAYLESLHLARISDVCIFGASSQKYAVYRAKKCPTSLSFELGERWLKHGLLTIGSPVFRQWYLNYFRFYHKANFYKLCCSSFTAGDDELIFTYKNKHYKWGYFTKVDERFVVGASPDVSTAENLHTLMWCARFLRLKHPELPVQLAARLKSKGYEFVLSMYGNGVELDKTKALVKQLGVEDVVSFKGNLPNDEILEAMRKHEIFLFTSDKNEGWGAVANEAMSNGCAIVASDAIGSVPFLVKDGENGCVFESCNLDSLYEKVKWLFDNADKRRHLAVNACQSMRKVWSPQNAAEKFLKLVEDLRNERESSIIEGPCSIAYPIKE